MELALGDLYAGVFANDDAWRDAIVAAGEASGDHVWPFPLHRRYRRFVDSNFADMKNASILRQGVPGARRRVPARVRRRRARGRTSTWPGPAFLTWLARRLPRRSRAARATACG